MSDVREILTRLRERTQRWLDETARCNYGTLAPGEVLAILAKLDEFESRLDDHERRLSLLEARDAGRFDPVFHGRGKV